MYFLNQSIKADPHRRWALPDRIFFGHGACHILAGTWLGMYPDAGFVVVWLRPRDGLPGNHLFVTDGTVAFDYRGWTRLPRLLAWLERGWRMRHPDWAADLTPIDFDPLDTRALNARGMRGPDQYLHDPIPRARAFIRARTPPHAITSTLAAPRQDNAQPTASR